MIAHPIRRMRGDNETRCPQPAGDPRIKIGVGPRPTARNRGSIVFNGPAMHFPLMNFILLPSTVDAPDPAALDSDLTRHASRPVARIWETSPALVMPRSYLRYPNVDAMRARFAARGLPVYVRNSGGGLVPQGPGIVNLSLAYPLLGPPGRWLEPVYLHLCTLLSEALAPLGVDAHPASVAGSFCDGQFNLACGQGGSTRKIAGTAQHWRINTSGDSGYTVLAHALLLVQPDLATIHRELNAFERALGSGRSYDVSKTTTVASLTEKGDDGDLMQRVRRQLHAVVTHASPPEVGAASGR